VTALRSTVVLAKVRTDDSGKKMQRMRSRNVAGLQHGRRILPRLCAKRTHFGGAVVLRNLVMT